MKMGQLRSITKEKCHGVANIVEDEEMSIGTGLEPPSLCLLGVISEKRTSYMIRIRNLKLK